MTEKRVRTESDSMGPVQIPEEAYWGAQAQRASMNFNVSPLRIPLPFLRALASIKRAAARTNLELGQLDAKIAGGIERAASEIVEGRWNDQFPIDVFQTGSGTSWNMNINEVIANRANELLGGQKGSRSPVHPNDHVNKGQSSNDTIPTAMNVAARVEAARLVAALGQLESGLGAKAQELDGVLKLGRTHLQDAVPMTLGQEFSGYREQIRKSRGRIERTFPSLEELALGGTALGTGINADPEYAPRTIKALAAEYGVPFRRADNYFEAMGARDSILELAGALNSLAVALMKIAQDLRLLSSGPRSGIGEIQLPPLQPGSSIMPGKINPVIPEMMIQVAAHVMGKHLSITIACQNAPLELNMMQPLLAHEISSALELLTNAVKAFDERCVRGITAEVAHCRELIDWSLALVTPLALKVGYDRAAKIAHRAYKERKKVREVVLEEGILTEAEADEILDPESMLGRT